MTGLDAAHSPGAVPARCEFLTEDRVPRITSHFRRRTAAGPRIGRMAGAEPTGLRLTNRHRSCVVLLVDAGGKTPTRGRLGATSATDRDAADSRDLANGLKVRNPNSGEGLRRKQCPIDRREITSVTRHFPGWGGIALLFVSECSLALQNCSREVQFERFKTGKEIPAETVEDGSYLRT
jgi:hypothetical protein